MTSAVPLIHVPVTFLIPADLSGPSEQIFRHVQGLDNDRTVVILDPPRKGQHP